MCVLNSEENALLLLLILFLPTKYSSSFPPRFPCQILMSAKGTHSERGLRYGDDERKPFSASRPLLWGSLYLDSAKWCQRHTRWMTIVGWCAKRSRCIASSFSLFRR